MAIAEPKFMSYEDYLKEGETNWRYDIIDGVRVDMASPTAYHQRIAQKITRLLEDYEAVGPGLTFAAPCDVQISLYPLRTRQPDVMFVSNLRLGDRPLSAPPPLDAVPELVVEVISDSDRERVLNAKIADFHAIGVDECWIVRPNGRTVEVLSAIQSGWQQAAIYGETETVTSLVLPGLEVAVADIFRVR
jgi:Uma2 family endonuclease